MYISRLPTTCERSEQDLLPKVSVFMREYTLVRHLLQWSGASHTAKNLIIPTKKVSE